jgi:2-methylisocitrate lyase-like PEP mutase family enzyme
VSAEHANRLRELHTPGDPLILVNVWDAAGARAVAAAEGCRAIATASWSIAAAHDYADGEKIPLDLMIGAIERIAAAVDLPVTADIESGFGDTPAEVSETVARVIAAGAAGVNLEDRLRPLEEHAAILAAVREQGEREGVRLVINGRSDEFLLGERRLGEAIARGRAYLDAGADCFFLPGLVDLGDTRRLVQELGGAPVNVLAIPSSPPLTELAAAGVARVSFGPGPMGVAYAALRDAAETLLARGAYPPELAYRPGS